MATVRKYRKKPVPHAEKPDKSIMSPVITVRISDEEKERLDQIMKSLNVKRYSDVMRMALHMVQLQKFPQGIQVNAL